MKKLVVVLAVAMAAVLLFSGCAKMMENAMEKAVEKAIEKDSGAKVDLSNEDGSVTVKGEDGATFQAGGDIKWPNNVPDGVPMLDKATLTLVTSDKSAFMIGFEKAEPKAIENYIAQLTDAGFEETSTFKDDSNIMNSYTKDKVQVGITYSSEDKTGLLTINITQE